LEILLDNGKLSIFTVYSNVIQIQFFNDNTLSSDESTLSIVLLSTIDFILFHVDVYRFGLYSTTSLFGIGQRKTNTIFLFDFKIHFHRFSSHWFDRIAASF